MAEIETALAGMPDRWWRELAKVAEFLLSGMRQSPALANYLAGLQGEDIVGAAVVAIQLGASGVRGRKVRKHHLENNKALSRCLKGIISSMVSNFRRHPEPWLRGELTAGEQDDLLPIKVKDPVDLRRDLEIRDLVRVVTARALSEISGKGQLAVLQEYASGFGHDPILPSAKQSKFTRYRVRQVLRKHLKELAVTDLRTENATGRELLI